jgi:two-component system, OmpR family, alkaline phosphatase synthesis response regulator PhoP
MKNNILIIEDDIKNSKLLKHTLENNNFLFHFVDNGKKSLEYLNKQEIDIILLDLNLPDTSGFELLRRIKNSSTYQHIPIIIITSNKDKLDTVLALEIGADDYIIKPFHQRELIARINVVLRRYKLNSKNPSNTLSFGDLKIDIDTRKVSLFNKNIDLTFKEFEILILLSSTPGKVFSRDEIINTIWGYEYITVTRAVDMHIASLRKKICDTKQNNLYIETIRGVGYRFRK